MTSIASIPAGRSIAGPAARAEIACAHCGLPVPAGLVEVAAPADGQFCCGGCRMVYETIHACGLDRYYALRREADAAVTAPATKTGRRYEALDDPAFHERFVTSAGGGRREVTLYLDGVHCAACVWLVERLPHVQGGVLDARLDYGRRTVRVAWDAERVRLSRVARLLDRLGYPPHPCAPGAAEAAARREDRRHLLRVGVAGACAGNAMLIAFALYGGMLHGIDPAYRTLLRAAGLGLAVVALAGPGRVFFVGAMAALRTRMMHMDLPVAIALAAGTAWGGVNTVLGRGEVYFESLTAVVFLLLVGRWMQHRQQRAAHRAVERLFAVTPATARRLEAGGAVREVPVEALAPGALVEVRAGDTVPADGALDAGASVFDGSALTGESWPVPRGPGDVVHAGTVNVGSRVVVRVEAVGADSRLGRLALMIETLARERAPIVRLADVAARRFVTVVLALAALTFLLWLPRDPALAVEHAIALLIVTCPCALGLATPLAVVAAVGRAARAGILVKGGAVVERLAGGGLVLLDKTGTLTEGRTRLVEWVGDDDARPLVAAVEANVAHPIARAFVAAFATPDERAPERVEATSAPGGGVHGRVDGRAVVVGSTAWVRGRLPAGAVPAWAERAETRCLDRALTPVLVAVDGAVVGVAGFGDPVRDGAAAALRALADLGWEIGVLSGDHPAVVAAVAGRLGLPAARCEGGATPERKVAAVREAQTRYHTVVMVGDGVNDAAALAAASVGVAVHGSAEASLQAADVYLTRPGLGAVAELVRGSRRTVGVIRRNVIASVLYNAVTASLAMGGMMNPLVAAILMPISSLTVVALSHRARTFDAEA